MRRLSLVVVLAAACTPQPPPQLAATAPEELCSTLVAAQCERQRRCRLLSASFDCETAQFVSVCPFRELQGVNAGLLNYDGLAATRCVVSERSRACDVSPRSADCQAIFYGSPGEGEPCSFGCAPGLWCMPASLTCGVCSMPRAAVAPAPTPVGDACESPAADAPERCEPSAQCSELDGGWRCARRPAADEPCEPIARPACLTPLACRRAADGSFRCQSALDVGAPCEFRECLGGLACQGGRCTALAKAGEPCASADQCASIGAGCLGGVCSPEPIGADCSATPCPQLTYCDAQHHCQARLPRGAACDADQCELGLGCFSPDGGAATCLLLGELRCR